jgi:methyltransferase-like protein
MTNTQKIEKVAKDLAKANNTVTTLEIKTELRKLFPREQWFQSDISDVMDDLNNEGKFTYVDQGTYRIYSLVSVNPVTSPKSTPTKTVAVKTNPTKTRISKTKAVDILKETKGRYFGVTFTKKDGSVRKMKCKMEISTPSPLGYILVKDVKENTPKSLNLQTLSEIRMNGTIYLVG